MEPVSPGCHLPFKALFSHPYRQNQQTRSWEKYMPVPRGPSCILRIAEKLALVDRVSLESPLRDGGEGCPHADWCGQWTRHLESGSVINLLPGDGLLPAGPQSSTCGDDPHFISYTSRKSRGNLAREAVQVGVLFSLLPSVFSVHSWSHLQPHLLPLQSHLSIPTVPLAHIHRSSCLHYRWPGCLSHNLSKLNHRELNFCSPLQAEKPRAKAMHVFLLSCD